MSGVPELHYFDFDRGGRAFALRAAFHAVKQEYKDVRFQFPEFQEMKKQGKYVAGVPILKLPSGKVLKNEERKLFEIHRIKTDVLIAELISSKK